MILEPGGEEPCTVRLQGTSLRGKGESIESYIRPIRGYLKVTYPVYEASVRFPRVGRLYAPKTAGPYDCWTLPGSSPKDAPRPLEP